MTVSTFSVPSKKYEVDRVQNAEAAKTFPPVNYDKSALTSAQAVIKNLNTFRWKEFEFPASVLEFDYVSEAKVATYEYAMRDGAEHERVKQFLVFRLRGLFIGEGALENAKKLISTDNNKTGIFFHADFIEKECILKSLNVQQRGEEEYTEEATRYPAFEFQCEFWEQVPNTAVALGSITSTIMPAPISKPESDYYLTNTTITEADYKTDWDLFKAIRAGKVNPSNSDDDWTAMYVSGAETGLMTISRTAWVLYNQIIDGDIRPGTNEESWTALYENDEPTKAQRIAWWAWSALNENDAVISEKQQWYVVKAGDTPSVIANNFGLSIMDLYSANQGVYVRDNPVSGSIEQSGGGEIPSTTLKTWNAYLATIGNGATKGTEAVTAYFGAEGYGEGEGLGLYHNGIDIDGVVDDIIYAYIAGNVEYAAYETGYGSVIKIRSDDGYLQKYAHLNDILVSVGDRIATGQKIGVMGASGSCWSGGVWYPNVNRTKEYFDSGDPTYPNIAGSHLHFEVRNPSKAAINPIEYIKQKAGVDSGSSTSFSSSSPILGKGVDGRFWKTLYKIYAGDRIKIPRNFDKQTEVTTLPLTTVTT